MNAELNPARLEQLVERMLTELGAVFTAPLVRIGDELGIYEALRDAGSSTSAELASRTGLSERYLREWLAAHAAAGYVEYDSSEQRFHLSPEQVAVFADAGSPANMLGAFEMASANMADVPKIAKAFRTGEGVGWAQHNHHLFSGTERFFRPGYAAHLVKDWLPALAGVVEKLEAGARVADLACGHGVSTLLMAQAFPLSTFVGFDFHAPSIKRALQLARSNGRPGNLSFDVASAHDFPMGPYDLVTVFDALHDMGDPIAFAGRVRESLALQGVFMIVEPYAEDTLAENLNPVSRLYYAGSTMICTPAALAQDADCALGAQAGESRLRAILERAGFTRVRRAAATKFNLILEARL